MPRKPKPWFRFYVEATHDKKLRRLPVSFRWLWVSILSLSRQSPIPGYLLITEAVPVGSRELADEAAIKEADVKKGLEEFVAQEMLEWDEALGCWHVINWKKRQFESDDTTERTRKTRSKPPPLEQPNDVPKVHEKEQEGVPKGESPIQRVTEEPSEESQIVVPTEPATNGSLARGGGTSQEQKLARRHLQTLEPIIGSGKSFDLLHEFKTIWPLAWQEAIDSGLNPKSVGINLLGNFIATVTESNPDWPRAGQLVGRFGRLALLGIDEGLIANADDPYRYAFRVCQNRATEIRATEKANG